MMPPMMMMLTESWSLWANHAAQAQKKRDPGTEPFFAPHPFLKKLGRGLHGDAACKIGRL